ncbi:flagellar hook-associated protein 1 FlgK [Modestobacter sp. DSM 44400]|uniref:flagellar hook-associated protein FlgK n=1 Tax=Modestobacter sp. DSM 44400 TaxID=1550230 RepID=UPI00089703DC|nr:flagellar hook-associated protein FlgK [Modestobacter sp. DSM 44400]SDX88002.1 flagellar hook-associated protein 1 FlgK [Modestobacter sp. DSM 44400]
MSTFSGLNTAVTALWAQQRGMDVTGQNIANVNTAGYSRQRADLQSVAGSTVPAVFSVGNGIGQGVSADTITRIRDAFLERRAQTEHAVTASLTVQDTTFTQMEDAFREPGTTGIAQQLTKMWAGWSDVMNNPTELGARSQVLQSTRTLVDGLHTASATLDQQWEQNHASLESLAADVNATAASIADLNVAIARASNAGMPSNELADKRDTLVLKLSDQVGATAAVGEDGSMTVTVGGSTLVSGSSVLALRLAGSTDPADAATDPPRLVTAPGGTTVRPGGTADGQLASMTRIIPKYRTQLDGIAQQLADQFNAVHTSGYDLKGNPGKPLFDDGAGGLTGITAATLDLAISSTDELAAASLSPATAGAVSGENGNADRIYQLRLASAGADANYRKLIVTLGVEASTTTNDLATQSVIATQVDASRESVAGVNLDEEMTNMLQFQHGYQAAGRLITAIDEMLDVLINRTGLVGR